ncbi:MAG: hypothetical protein PHQ72_04115 [Hespellia sp.]|nr:hypothetical protein [Hespellia sp.]
MYIKKSIISGMVLLVGAIILLAVAIVYGFTEVHISRGACAILWTACIFGGNLIIDKIEQHE